jgi:hypothetical protein
MFGFAPLSTTIVSELPRWSGYFYGQGLFGTAELGFSYAATVPFISLDTDRLPNQQFLGTFSGDLRIDRSIGTGNVGYGGFASSISELSLINADGEYDDVVAGWSINGQPISVTVGEMLGRDVVGPYDQFEVVASLMGERFQVSRRSLIIETRDLTIPLNKTVQTGVYSGTGGLEGDADIAGKRRPFGDGIVFNAAPQLVLASELLYQFNGEAVASVLAVKDGGAGLTFYADYASAAALRADALNIPGGSYGTSIAEGYFLLGALPAKGITVDFVGLRLTTADIIRNVALNSAELQDQDINDATFEEVNILQPAEIGYYLDANSSETCAEMFSRLMEGIGGWWGMSTMGRLQIRLMLAPDADESLASYNTTGTLIELDRIRLPDTVDPPPHRCRVAYARNWTIMSAGDLAGVIAETDPALAAYLGEPYKLAVTSDADSAAILGRFPFAPDPNPIESYFANVGDAQAEADRLLLLYSSGMSAYRFVAKNALFLHQIGDVVEITDSRLGLEEGRAVRLVAISDALSTMTTEMVGFG